jgi:hypothetical protein
MTAVNRERRTAEMQRVKVNVDVEMTPNLAGAILSYVAETDPFPADAIGTFFKVCRYQDASLSEFVDALLDLRNEGLITFLGHDCAVRLLWLTENGRLYAHELIGALCAMSDTGKLAEA